ncbi:hypothetical protein B0H17DRAFT_1326704 [Mycena rosella]|uniref:Secreted protein n=1 Tax=Mycena rosella TaxID=1033263 RepID=A0AAD7GS16_MYCRO|nr:hypothetical protein B0H17DRAFT_1326704 [Mycena rosella]
MAFSLLLLHSWCIWTGCSQEKHAPHTSHHLRYYSRPTQYFSKLCLRTTTHDRLTVTPTSADCAQIYSQLEFIYTLLVAQCVSHRVPAPARRLSPACVCAPPTRLRPRSETPYTTPPATQKSPFSRHPRPVPVLRGPRLPGRLAPATRDLPDVQATEPTRTRHDKCAACCIPYPSTPYAGHTGSQRHDPVFRGTYADPSSGSSVRIPGASVERLAFLRTCTQTLGIPIPT